MQIVLMINNSEKNKINKSISAVTTLEGSIKEPSSIIDPIITLQINNPVNFNYVYIPTFNRYYFVTNVTVVHSNIMKVSMHVDVLSSFKNQILTTPVLLSDSQVTQADKYLPGPVWRTKVKELTDIKVFPSGLSESGQFILITAGG